MIKFQRRFTLLMTAERSDTVVEPPNFYYHLTTIHCRDLPRFAGLARISCRNVRFSQSANCGKTSPCEALEAYDEDFVYLPRQYTNTIRLSFIYHPFPAVTFLKIHHFYTNGSEMAINGKPHKPYFSIIAAFLWHISS